MDIWNRPSKHHQQIIEPQPKRISTPAGQRLSVILDNGDASAKARESVRKSGLSAMLGEAPRESSEDQSNVSSGYSYTVWSDGEKFAALRNNKQVAKRGGWKRLLIILAIIIALIIALAVGLAVGLKKKSSNSNSASKAQATSSPSDSSNSPNPTATLSPTALPSAFPLGSYSYVTFLDTVQTNCTSNPLTWTCYPFTIYNTSPSKSVATFNWIISGSTGSYKITSTSNPFSISFQNADLELLDEGESTERYRFQVESTKTVSDVDGLTDDNTAAQCDFDNTSLTAFLYTKMKRSYPDTSTGDPTGDPSYAVWPFAVRVEQVVGGGQNVPSCTTASGASITQNIVAQDAGSLCSCLYKNWRTPT